MRFNLCLLALLGFYLGSCGGDSTFSDTAASLSQELRVINLSPGYQSTNVLPSQNSIVVVFSLPVDLQSVQSFYQLSKTPESGGTGMILNGNTTVSLSPDGLVATFQLNQLLDQNTRYTLTLPQSVRAQSGVALKFLTVHEFTTGSGEITSTSNDPENSPFVQFDALNTFSTGFSGCTSELQFTFNEDIVAAPIVRVNTFFRLFGGKILENTYLVPLQPSFSGLLNVWSMSFINPYSGVNDTSGFMQYEVTVPRNEVVDSEGNQMEEDYIATGRIPALCRG